MKWSWGKSIGLYLTDKKSQEFGDIISVRSYKRVIIDTGLSFCFLPEGQTAQVVLWYFFEYTVSQSDTDFAFASFSHAQVFQERPLQISDAVIDIRNQEPPILNVPSSF